MLPCRFVPKGTGSAIDVDAVRLGLPFIIECICAVVMPCNLDIMAHRTSCPRMALFVRCPNGPSRFLQPYSHVVVDLWERSSGWK